MSITYPIEVEVKPDLNNINPEGSQEKIKAQGLT